MLRAVLLDALGTLVDLESPAPLLAARLGVGEHEAERALRAEMDHYRGHAHEGRDPASLHELRARCAAIVGRELDREVRVEDLLGAIRFRAYPDAAPALTALRGAGLCLVVVSNWDISLQDTLRQVGLRELVDGVVTSAAVGAPKPDPAAFQHALGIAGCAPDEAVHVGDSQREDQAGARAAGVEPLLIDRGGRGDIASLTEVAERLVGLESGAGTRP